MAGHYRNVLRDVILGGLILLATFGIVVLILSPVLTKAKRGLHADWQYHKNTAAINKGMGFLITAGTREGDYHDFGMTILQVSPEGAAAAAGLRAGDKIKRFPYNLVKQMIVQRRGKTLVLPVERGGKHIDCTIDVPSFDLPFPNVKV